MDAEPEHLYILPPVQLDYTRCAKPLPDAERDEEERPVALVQKLNGREVEVVVVVVREEDEVDAREVGGVER